jgi:GTPase
MNNSIKTHAGYIAILGRTNVGKSTLLNSILAKKISITANKVQTTRQKILGVKTAGNYQAIYVDTPGIHEKSESKLNAYMNQEALSSVGDVDVIVFMIAGSKWLEEDEFVLKAIAKSKAPVILAINKIDLVTQKKNLLGFIEKVNAKYKFTAVVPISAEKGINVEALEKEIIKLLPQNHFFFPPEQKTDRNDKFLAAEIIREKLTRFLGQELPYALTVLIDQMESKKKVISISATIYVERPGQKSIIIGKGGELLKKIGMLARKDMEKFFGEKVYLQLWVKVKAKWTDDERLLKQMGYWT